VAVVGLGRSGSQDYCPLQCTARRVKASRLQDAIGSTPLASYRRRPDIYPAYPVNATPAFRVVIVLQGPSVGFLPKNISASTQRAGGAMALLCAQVDTGLIQLLGC
jgi:hypothetical protein